MKHKLIIFMSVLVMVLSCTVKPSRIKNPKEYSDKFSYTRDSKTGLCFALIAIRPEGGASQTGIGSACVPCTEAVLKEIKNSEKAYPYSY